MAAEIASRVEALQPNVLAGIHRHRWMRQGRHIRPKKSAPFLTVAPGRQNLQNPKSRVGTSLRQPRLPRVENGLHFLGHPVVRGAAKLPLGRRVLRTDGRNLRVLVPEAPKKSARENLRRDAWCITGAVSIFVSKQQAAQPRHVGDSFPQGPKQKERAIFNGDAYLALPGNPFFYIFLPLKNGGFMIFMSNVSSGNKGILSDGYGSKPCFCSQLRQLLDLPPSEALAGAHRRPHWCLLLHL
jgi:hypothetical protein